MCALVTLKVTYFLLPGRRYREYIARLLPNCRSCVLRLNPLRHYLVVAIKTCPMSRIFCIHSSVRVGRRRRAHGHPSHGLSSDRLSGLWLCLPVRVHGAVLAKANKSRQRNRKGKEEQNGHIQTKRVVLPYVPVGRARQFHIDALSYPLGREDLTRRGTGGNVCNTPPSRHVRHAHDNGKVSV